MKIRRIPIKDFYIRIPNEFRYEKVLVDDEDYEKVSQYKWYCAVFTNSYIVRADINGQKSVSLANFIMTNGKKLPDYHLYDHKDRNPFNNQKENLRYCSKFENNLNKGPRSGNKYKGITYCKRDRNWIVRIKLAGKCKHIGYFDNEINAALAYDVAARELFGEFAYLNFPNIESKSFKELGKRIK